MAMDKSNNNDEESRNKCEHQIVDETGAQDKEHCSELKLNEIKELNEKVLMIERERDAIKEERDSLNRKMNSFKEEKDELKEKYNSLTTKLRDHIECPVCLEVPTSGPVYVCPNGHFVCSKCKAANCPTCRCRMFNGKSLLAATVLENIEHECKHIECDELLPLEQYKQHLEFCQYRTVQCPGPNTQCGMEMPLSKLYDHILSECKGSYNYRMKASSESYPRVLRYPTEEGTGIALCWKGVYFYLSCDKSPPYNVFAVQLFGNAVECKDYLVDIAVHRVGDKALIGKHAHRFSGEPLPIDMEKETRIVNGLIIGPIQMEKLVTETTEDIRVGITIDISKA